METTITILKENAPVAVMLLLAVMFLQHDLGGEIQALRADMAAGFQAIRTEMAAGDQAIRAEMAAGEKAVRSELTREFKAERADISQLGERLARVETRLDSIEDRFYGESDQTTRP